MDTFTVEVGLAASLAVASGASAASLHGMLKQNHGQGGGSNESQQSVVYVIYLLNSGSC